MAGNGTTAKKDTPGVIAPPPLIVLGFLVVGFAADWLLDGAGFPLPDGVRYGLAALLAVTGALLAIAGTRRFKQAGTNVPPWQPATALVTSGIYRYTRNPMYLGLSVFYAGLALLINGVVTLLLLPALLLVMHYGVVLREERYLEAKFGENYRRYKQAVRRWV